GMPVDGRAAHAHQRPVDDGIALLVRRDIEETAEQEDARGDGDNDGKGTDHSENTHRNLAKQPGEGTCILGPLARQFDPTGGGPGTPNVRRLTRWRWSRTTATSPTISLRTASIIWRRGAQRRADAVGRYLSELKMAAAA